MALTPQQIRETQDALSRHSGNVSAVARELGLTRSTVQNRMQRLSEATGKAANSNEKPRYRIPYVRANDACVSNPANDERQEAIRVCVIGDLHVAPGQDLSRLKWIARHIGETQPDRIVQIGDWASFDSVSSHDPIGSVKQKHRPSLRQDMEALHESLYLFDRELGPSDIKRDITLGNHEERVLRYEQLRSELEDSLWLEVLQSFSRFRWQTHDYTAVMFIQGVGFCHVPKNRMGKPHSSPNIIGNNLTHDLIYGHSHQAGHWPFPKIGIGQEEIGEGVTLLNVGTALPHGHVESYAKLSQTGWWWGIYDVTIRNGRIDDLARIGMKTLEQKYG